VRVPDPQRRCRLPLLLGRVEDLEHPLRRGNTGLEEVGHRRDLRQRLGELAGVLDERLDVTERHRAVGDPQTTEDGDDDVVEVPDEHHRRHDDAADELGAERGLVEVVVLGLERLLRLLLPSEDLDEAVSGEGLLDDAVELPGVLPLLNEELLGALGDPLREKHGDRDRHEGDEGEHPRDAEHHRHHGDDGEHRGEQLAQRLLQAHLDVVHVVGDPAEQLTTRLAVEVGQGQPVELGLHVGTQLEHRPLDDGRQEPAREPLEERRDDVEPHDQEQDVRERGEVDTHSRDDVHPGEQVGELALAAAPEPGDHGFLARPRGQPRAEEAFEDEVRRVPEDLRPDRAEHHARHGQDDDEQDGSALRPKPRHEALRRRGETARLLTRHTHRHRSAPGQS